MDVEHELEVLQNWKSVQCDLLNFTLKATPLLTCSWRSMIEMQIVHCTKGRVHLYWEPFTIGDMIECDRFREIRYRQTRYGFLGLAPDYLASHNFPDIPQDFANLCALLLHSAECQLFIHYQSSGLIPLLPGEQVDRLTRRERDVLLGLIKGESDEEMSESLGIEPTTVHTHRKHLYRRLVVHSAQEAALRCFTQRIVDWLDGPCTKSEENRRVSSGW
ncbi:MAG: LuxR family transcriptional regulator [Ktedonobacteraceae bacterium]